MALSNTAVPVYYKKFRDAVNRGEIPINKQIEMEMFRIDDLIADPAYYYDPDKVEGFIAYCEAELTLTDGNEVKLLETFKLWGEQIFGWYYYKPVTQYDPALGRRVQRQVLRRLTVKQYLIVARGAAKSMYASFVQAYFLIIDRDTTHQITTAPTMKQALEVMSPLQTAITRHRGPLFEFMTEGTIHSTTGNKNNKVKLASTKNGIENFVTGSLLEVRPMSRDKLQGLRPKISTVDEWLSGDIREDVIGAIEQGASKHEEYLILAISSEGTVRNGAGDTMKMELEQILRGDQYAPHVSIWHYRLDSIDEVSKPQMWPKAQPNIDITVSYETYERDVERMEANPATRNDILAKRFGIPMEGFTYYFPFEETVPHPYRPRRFWKMLCSMGVDLSQGDDFCAFTFLFPLPRGQFGVRTRSYITENTHMKLSGAARAKYQEFINENTLHVMNGTVLDMMEVYDDLEKYIETEHFEVRSVGYDPYGAREFIERWVVENGDYAVMKVTQGARTESIPLGEIKKISEERDLIFDELLMSYAMGNAVTLEDTNGNRKLWKKRHEEKIDNVAALLDAYVAWKANKDSFE